jgi:hypothetical protein
MVPSTRRIATAFCPHTESLGKKGGLSLSPSGSIAWAISMLESQGMPWEEIATILAADEPVLIRRFFELHRERLEEHFAAQRRTLVRFERLLTAPSSTSTSAARSVVVDGRTGPRRVTSPPPTGRSAPRKAQPSPGA